VEENWEIQTGEYTSNIGEGWTFNLSEEGAKLLQEGIGPFKLNTSFFKISVGLKFLF